MLRCFSIEFEKLRCRNSFYFCFEMFKATLQSKFIFINRFLDNRCRFSRIETVIWQSKRILLLFVGNILDLTYSKLSNWSYTTIGDNTTHKWSSWFFEHLIIQKLVSKCWVIFWNLFHEFFGIKRSTCTLYINAQMLKCAICWRGFTASL